MARASSFRTERELVRSFVHYYHAVISKHGVQLLRELKTPNGLPDIVLFTRHGSKQKLLTVATLPERLAFLAGPDALPVSFEFEIIKRITGLSESGVRGFLRKFEDLGLIRKLSKERWRVRRTLPPPIGYICAIEAKRREWRKALYQASRYQDFAHQAWVLLDSAKVVPALQALDKFRKLNVGLASINTGKEVMVHWIPRTEIPKFHTRFWSTNVAIAQQIT